MEQDPLIGARNLSPRATIFTALLLLATTSTIQAAQELEALERLGDEDTVKIWSDRGGLAREDFICWGPVIPENTDFKTFGYRGQKNHDDIKDPIYAFLAKDLLLASMDKPTGFEFIWDDRRSVNWKDVSVWRPKCAEGYVALGDFFYPGNKIKRPGADLTENVRCVRIDLTAPCKINVKIWDDSRSLASQDVSVWEVDFAANDTMLGGFLFANSERDKPPGIEARCLLKSSFTITKSFT